MQALSCDPEIGKLILKATKPVLIDGLLKAAFETNDIELIRLVIDKFPITCEDVTWALGYEISRLRKTGLLYRLLKPGVVQEVLIHISKNWYYEHTLKSVINALKDPVSGAYELLETQNLEAAMRVCGGSGGKMMVLIDVARALVEEIHIKQLETDIHSSTKTPTLDITSALRSTLKNGNKRLMLELYGLEGVRYDSDMLFRQLLSRPPVLKLYSIYGSLFELVYNHMPANKVISSDELMMAIKSGYTVAKQVIGRLDKNRVWPDTVVSEALATAADPLYNGCKTIDLIIGSCGADLFIRNSSKALQIATKARNRDVIERLLSCGAIPLLHEELATHKASIIVLKAIKSGEIDITSLNDSDLRDYMKLAIEYRRYTALNELLNEFRDVRKLVDTQLTSNASEVLRHVNHRRQLKFFS
jgi:hypothetical protein